MTSMETSRTCFGTPRVRSARAVVAPVVAGGTGAGHQERRQAVVFRLDQVGEDAVGGIFGEDEIWYRTGYGLTLFLQE